MKTDMDLLQRYVRHNDAAAFAMLVDRHEAFVFNVAMRITRNRADAEDVAQKCFLQLAKQAATITASVPGWLHKMAQWQSFQLIRECVSRRAREQEAAEQLYVVDGPPEWAEIDAVIDEAMAQLPDEQRAFLVLYYFERHTHEEVAQLIGTSRRTALRRCNDALEDLRKLLQKKEISLHATSLGALVMAHGNGIAVPAALRGSLMKIALAGNKIVAGAAGKSAVAAAHKALWVKVAASATGAVVVGSVAVVSYVHFSSGERIPADENSKERVQQVAKSAQESTQMKTVTNWMRAAVVAGGLLQATNLAVAQNSPQNPSSLPRPYAVPGYVNSSPLINANGNPQVGANSSQVLVAPGTVGTDEARDATVIGTVSKKSGNMDEGEKGFYAIETGAQNASAQINARPQTNTRALTYYTKLDLSAFVGQKVKVVGKMKGLWFTVITSTTPVQQ